MSDRKRAEAIVARCACGACFKAPASAIGKRTICPDCGQPLVIDARVAAGAAAAAGRAVDGGPKKSAPAKPSKPRTPPPPPPAPIWSELLGNTPLAGVGDGDGIPCPHCRAWLPRAAVLCVQCGYDKRHGKLHRTQTPGLGGSEPGAKTPSKKPAKGRKLSFAIVPPQFAD